VLHSNTNPLNPMIQTEFKRIVSPLKYQTRCVATFPDKQGFLVGSIEGRVAVQHIDDSEQAKNFTFKCHRDNNDVYAVNSINFHPVRLVKTKPDLFFGGMSIHDQLTHH
jgi:hypothetical protein